MVRQYPHTLIIELPLVVTEAYQDDNGHWVQPASSGNTHFIPCRAEVNGSGQLVISTDGKELHYGWNVFTPKECPDIKPEMQISIQDEQGEEIAKGKAKRFIRQQLNARLWL